MTNWQNTLLQVTHHPTALGFGAYHEVGHIVVAKLVGKAIRNILLCVDPTGDWGGEANYDLYSAFDPEWTNLNLDRYIPYHTLHLPYPGHLYLPDEHKDDRDYCAIQFAGKVAESLLYEQLGIPESPALWNEDAQDVRQAKERILRFKPEEQEKELLNAKNRARFLLSNPICSQMLGNLAQELINSILFNKEPDRQYERNNIPVKEYEFGSNQIYMNLALTLTGNNPMTI